MPSSLTSIVVRPYPTPRSEMNRSGALHLAGPSPAGLRRSRGKYHRVAHVFPFCPWKCSQTFYYMLVYFTHYAGHHPVQRRRPWDPRPSYRRRVHIRSDIGAQRRISGFVYGPKLCRPQRAEHRPGHVHILRGGQTIIPAQQHSVRSSPVAVQRRDPHQSRHTALPGPCHAGPERPA